ncbi:helix-turn-helix domain-containing protein [Levilactobacillus brevis]|uniref:helix-turn-helix domain-containing protein n=1 Tax=Levilactobacillus brevis TaxID=1580 RepID=UPI0031E10F02
MLANRLSVLMAERQLSIKQVIDATGISRNTISNISNNPNANVATDTIDKLCNYMGIQPNDFFVYAPYQIEMSAHPCQDGYGFINGEVLHNQSATSFSYRIRLVDTLEDNSGRPLYAIPLVFVIVESNIDENVLDSVYKDVPVTFQTRIKNDLLQVTMDVLQNKSFDLKTPNNKTETSLHNYLKEMTNGSTRMLIRLPWADYTKTLTLMKNGRLHFEA